MERRFSLAHLTVIGCPPPEAVHVAADTGYDFVSLRVIPLGTPVYDLANDKAMMRETKAALAETGLPVLDIELARILPGLDPKTYAPAFEVAAELGAKQVISSLWVPDRAFATDTFAALCDVAAPFGLTINLEYLPFVELGRFDDVLAVLRAANRKNSGLLIDTLYASPSKVDPAAVAKLPRAWFNFIHLCDGPRELPKLGSPEMFEVVRNGRLYPGEGTVDLAGILARLPDVPCSIELPNGARVAELGYAGHARRCLEAAKRLRATLVAA